MARQPVADWKIVKAEYITTTLSVDAIAKKFGLSLSSVRTRATKEGWVEQRSLYSKKAEARYIEKASNTRADSIAKMNEAHTQVAKSLASTAALVLQKSVKRNEAGQVVGTDLEPRDINSLSAALVNAQKIERIAAGMSTENTSIHAHIDEADPLSILTPDAKAAIYKALDGSY